MAQIDCSGSLQLCRLRIANLEPNGVPDPGAGNVYVTDAMVELGFELELSTGDDLEQKNGCGDICLAFRDCDRLKRLNMTMQICRPDPEIFAMTTGGETQVDGETVKGFAPAAVGAVCPNGVMIEAWTKAWDTSAQAVDHPYWRWVFGKTTWQPGPTTLNNGLLVPTLTGFGYENPNAHDGPANDIPSYVDTDRLYVVFRDTSMPEATCGASELVAS